MLRKIFSIVNTLAQQRLALRGNDNDECSNLYRTLKMQVEDVSELNSWLNRTILISGYLMIINGILEILANKIV